MLRTIYIRAGHLSQDRRKQIHVVSVTGFTLRKEKKNKVNCTK